MLENPAGTEEIGRHGMAAVRTTYDWEAESEKLNELYRSMGR